MFCANSLRLDYPTKDLKPRREVKIDLRPDQYTRKLSAKRSPRNPNSSKPPIYIHAQPRAELLPFDFIQQNPY